MEQKYLLSMRKHDNFVGRIKQGHAELQLGPISIYGHIKKNSLWSVFMS